MNLIVSTTFGWNIGDQFILDGVQKILHSVFGEHYRTVWHDRNPGNLGSSDGAVRDAIACGWAEKIVVAGTPGWTTECAKLYEMALLAKLPIYLIGIGAGAPIDYLTQTIKSQYWVENAVGLAEVVICRDEIARDTVLRFRSNAELLPCPAMFCGDEVRTGAAGVAHVLGEHFRGPFDVSHAVAHQSADLVKSCGHAFFSQNVEDYLRLYASFESAISSRLHGSIVCANFGVPVENLWPADDFRCATAWDVYLQGIKRGRASIAEDYCNRLIRHR